MKRAPRVLEWIVRIVSLLASGTEIVCALGAGDQLVGRSHECDNPAWVRSLPPCSAPAFDVQVSSKEINAEVARRLRSGEPLYLLYEDRIRDLKPDLVITQAHCEVCAVTPRDLERSGCATAGFVQLALSPGSLAEVLASIEQAAEAIGVPDRGRELAAAERARLERTLAMAAGFRRPSVVMLEWVDPAFAMANWGPELVEIANGELLIGKKGEHSGAMTPECVREADPEILIIAPCGFSLNRAMEELRVLQSWPWWKELRAVREGNVFFADGNLYFNRSGMTVTRTAEILAEIFHGLVFPDTGKAADWRRLGEGKGEVR